MANMIPISTVTVGSTSVSSILFNNIPQSYTDLMILFSIRNAAASNYDNIVFTVNESTSSYNERVLYGDGSSVFSAVPGGGRTSNVQFLYTNSASSTSNTFSNGSIYIPNYSDSNNKNFSFDSVTENNATASIAALSTGIWSNTAPISSISLGANNGNFVQYSSATLYGIRKY